MNCVANVVFPAPDAPITTVVERSFRPPSRSGLSPKIPVRTLRTRADAARRYKNVLNRVSMGSITAPTLGETCPRNPSSSSRESPRMRRPSRRATSAPSRKNASDGTTPTWNRSHSGFSLSSRDTTAKRPLFSAARASNKGRNAWQKGHHPAQKRTTVGSGARSTSRSNASGVRTSMGPIGEIDGPIPYTGLVGTVLTVCEARPRARHNCFNARVASGPPPPGRDEGMVLGPACSEETKAYFARLRDAAETCYRVARAARAQGFDPELDVEIDLAEDLATRVERLLKDYGVTGVANRIRELSRDHDREEVSILVAKELAHRAERSDPPRRKEEAIGRAVRVGLAILTEGVLVAPLEGFTGVKVKSNPDGSTYADLYFAGPIRSAGGTGQALSVLIADVARRELGVGRYQPTREEIERFKEEVQLYRRVQHLQYTPTDKEVSLIVSNCPVAVNGEGTEDEEISGHRDLPRIETNRVRGGACLVVADGLCLKAPKIQKHVTRLKIDGWEFIDAYLKAKAHADVKEETDPSVDPSDTFIQQLVAGRPVLCHPSRPGGFRLRYGRARSAGLAALSIHPATMYLLNQFIAVGTQIKTERPGKAAAVTPCDALESPIVLLRSGDLVAVDDVDRAKRVRDEVEQIVDLGEILVPFGEFLENNHVLMPGAYAIEWYREELRRAAGELPANWRDPTASEAHDLSERYRVPLHPNYNLFWHDVPVDRLRALRQAILGGRFDGHALRIPTDSETKRTLLELGVLHRQGTDECVVESLARPLLR